MHYVMLIANRENTSPEDAEGLKVGIEEIFAWYDKWHAAGKVIEGTQLDAPGKAKTASRGADGQPVVTDGPYLELKEVIGGIIDLQTDDLDEAVAIASTWPGITHFDDKVEVRPVIER